MFHKVLFWAISLYSLHKLHVFVPRIKQFISFFADDATAHHGSKSSQAITYKLQAMATTADNWCEENIMKLVIIKTKVALVGSMQRLNKMIDTEKEINIFIKHIQLEQITQGR